MHKRSHRLRSMGNIVAASIVRKNMDKSIYAQVYKNAVGPEHGFLTPLQMIQKMLEEAAAFEKNDGPYMRFLIRLHYGGENKGKTSETMALMYIQREDHVWSIRGYVKGRPAGTYPYSNHGLPDGYDGIEIVGRVEHDDESWQDWL